MKNLEINRGLSPIITVGAVFGGGAKAMEVGKLKPVIDFITQKKIK